MRFLVDAGMPRQTAEMLRTLGHDAQDVRDLGMGAASDEAIAAHARAHELCILTRDFDFADLRSYPPREYFGIVVFEFPEAARREMILGTVRAFVEEGPVLAQLVGKLAIVEPHRIRLRESL